MVSENQFLQSFVKKIPPGYPSDALICLQIVADPRLQTVFFEENIFLYNNWMALPCLHKDCSQYIPYGVHTGAPGTIC